LLIKQRRLGLARKKAAHTAQIDNISEDNGTVSRKYSIEEQQQQQLLYPDLKSFELKTTRKIYPSLNNFDTETKQKYLNNLGSV
jgi:hypothetical protein